MNSFLRVFLDHPPIIFARTRRLLKSNAHGHGVMWHAEVPRDQQGARLLVWCCQSSELSNGIGKLLGIGILLESHDSAVGHAPDMGELRADFSTAFFVPAAVSAEHHDVIPGIQPFFRHHLKIRPFRSKSHENSFEHRLWAAIRITIGVDEVFCLAPLDMLVHLAKN